MRNLLKEQVSRDQFLSAIQPAFPAESGFGGPRLWQSHPLAAIVRQTALDWSKKPTPEYPPGSFGEFHRNGSREGHESPYLERRMRFAIFAMAWLLQPAEERILDALTTEWSAILDELSWASPAHVPDESGVDPTCLDLFCAMTAADLAEALVLLSSGIPRELRERTLARLNYLFECFLGRHGCREWGWFRSNHNWNAVTHRGIIGAALAVSSDESLLAALLEKTAANLGRFLDGINEDGWCTEGPGYWAYGFGNFCQLNDLLEKRTGMNWSLFADDPHVEAIAGAGALAFFETGEVINFSDAAYGGTYANPWLWDQLASRFENASCRHAVASTVEAFRKDPARLLTEEHCRFPGLIRMFSVPGSAAGRDAPGPKRKVFLANSALWMDEREWFGRVIAVVVKAGHNAEHHNHNDCGSFLVFVDGISVLGDPGCGRYTKAYFRPGRYSQITTRSWSHSVPLVNGCEQSSGRTAAARVLDWCLDDEKSFIEIDLTGCYPSGCGAMSVVRTVSIVETRVRVVDRFVLERKDALETALLTHAGVGLDDGLTRLSTRSATASIVPHPGSIVARADTFSYHDRLGRPLSATRLQIIPQDGLTDVVEIGYDIAIDQPQSSS